MMYRRRGFTLIELAEAAVLEAVKSPATAGITGFMIPHPAKRIFRAVLPIGTGGIKM